MESAILDLQAFDTCIIWMTCYFPLRKCSCAYYITVHGASRPICCLWVQSQEFCYLHQTLLECYVIHHPWTENSFWVLWFRKVSLKPVHNYRCPHLNDMELCIHFINMQMRHSRWVLALLSICTAFKSKFPEVLTIIHWLFIFWNLKFCQVKFPLSLLDILNTIYIFSGRERQMPAWVASWPLTFICKVVFRLVSRMELGKKP